MRYAQLIRDFIRTLIGSRYIAQLETDLIQMRQEREYFKGRAERLEMLFLSRPRQVEHYSRAEAAELRGNRRRTLQELQQELTESELKAEEAKRNN